MVGPERASVLLLALLACGAAPTEAPLPQVPFDGSTYWPGAEWRTARPDQVAFDRPALNGLVSQIRSRSIPFLNSLIVVRQGYLVVEEYFNGSSRGDVHTMQSVSKSVT